MEPQASLDINQELSKPYIFMGLLTSSGGRQHSSSLSIFVGVNILVLKKLKAKISCYIFKARIKTLLGKTLDSEYEEWVVYVPQAKCFGIFIQ